MLLLRSRFSIFAINAICILGSFASQIGFGQQSQESDDPEKAYLEYIAPMTFEMEIGLKVQSSDGSMFGTNAQTVFPADWPEQKIEVVDVRVGPPFRYALRDLPGGNKQLLFQAQSIPANTQVEAIVRIRVTKQHIVGPEDTAHFTVPKRLPSEIRKYLGNSPYIEANSSEIKKIVREIDAKEPLTEWKRVEMLYDWVRENIAYRDGDIKSVRDTLRDRSGDCEEMTSTFVALCRAARVPARVVWIPNHCYPEFYMEDGEGVGTWFPCQAAGTRNFGSMPEYLPILQKGDRFKVPERTKLQRYLADYLKSQRVTGRGKPSVTFVRELLGEAATLKSPDLDGAANEAP